MGTYAPTHDDRAAGGRAIERDSRALLGHVMGYVAITVGFFALGAYLGRDLDGGAGLLFFLGTFAAIAGLNVAVSSGREQLAIGMLFGLGLLLGLAVAPVLSDYVGADPSALWQAAGATAAFVAIPGANVIYAVAGLVIFGGFTIIDFNRLRQNDGGSAVLIASSIFLDIFNVFLLLLDLFGGSRD